MPFFQRRIIASVSEGSSFFWSMDRTSAGDTLREGRRSLHSDARRDYSVGSTLRIEAPWLLPTQSVLGSAFESSTKTRRILVGRGVVYSVYWPVLMSSRDTRSVSIEPVQASSPLLPASAS